MDLSDVNALILNPALSVLPSKMDSPEARVMMLAIGFQESDFDHRRQVRGPARGYWQFEISGVRGVMAHPRTRGYAKSVLDRLDYQSDSTSVYNCLACSGLTAAIIARLYLWTDPGALPSIHDADAAWDLYVRTWRPGKPSRTRWVSSHQRALAAVMQGAVQ